MAIRKLPKKVETQLNQISEVTLEVHDPQTYQMACEHLSVVQTMRRTITSHYKPIKDALNGTRKTVLDMEKSDLAKLAPSEERLSVLIQEYEDTNEDGLDQAALTEQLNHHRLTTSRVVVEDVDALIKAIAEGKVSSDVVKPNIPALNKIAKQFGGLFSMPGCRVETDVTLVTR